LQLFAANNTDSDPSTIQHWAVVVHFPRGKKTCKLIEIGENDKGKLQSGRAEIVFKDIEIFEKATPISGLPLLHLVNY
jgi:hypothetical protein